LSVVKDRLFGRVQKRSGVRDVASPGVEDKDSWFCLVLKEGESGDMPSPVVEDSQFRRVLKWKRETLEFIVWACSDAGDGGGWKRVLT